MKLVYFQLSGRRHTGQRAEQLFTAALPFGFDEVCTTAQVHPDKSSGFRYYVLAGPVGVAATIEVGFDTREEMMAWAAEARLVEPTDELATACYRALYPLATSEDFPLEDPA